MPLLHLTKLNNHERMMSFNRQPARRQASSARRKKSNTRAAGKRPTSGGARRAAAACGAACRVRRPGADRARPGVAGLQLFAQEEAAAAGERVVQEQAEVWQRGAEGSGGPWEAAGAGAVRRGAGEREREGV